jgi:hypothetical protein
MPSAKVTYRRRGKIARPAAAATAIWTEELAKASDAELAPALRELVQAWRAHYALLELKPPQQDIRATLEALSCIGNEDARIAAPAMDPWTQAWLATAALRVFRRKHGAKANIAFEGLNASSWAPQRLRSMAQIALTALPRTPGGRPSRRKDLDIMRALLACWNRPLSGHVRPEELELLRFVRRYGTFARFAGDIFRRIGRQLGRSQLSALSAQAQRRAG